MQSFQSHSGLSNFIARLELEVEHCRKQQPFQIQAGPQRRDSLAEALEQHRAEEEARNENMEMDPSAVSNDGLPKDIRQKIDSRHNCDYLRSSWECDSPTLTYR